MTAFALAHLHTSSTHDDVLTYLERIQATLEPFDGRFVAHGPEVEVIDADAVNEAYDRLLKNDVSYRFVIDMSRGL